MENEIREINVTEIKAEKPKFKEKHPKIWTAGKYVGVGIAGIAIGLGLGKKNGSKDVDIENIFDDVDLEKIDL